MERGILVQRSMNSRFIIIGNKFAEDRAQVRLPEHDHVVETFLSDRADQSLHVRILPWRSRCDRPVPNAQPASPVSTLGFGARQSGAEYGQWGRESTGAWRAVLDDLVRRGLRRPEFLIVDGAPGLDNAIVAVWDGVPIIETSSSPSGRGKA
jgi:hypothetical protein